MLDPDIVLNAFVAALQTIPSLVSALGSASYIQGHHFSFGTENSLERSVYQMNSPGVLVAYIALIAGNFSAEEAWKHQFQIYIRPKNSASGVNPVGCSPPHLWFLMMNSAVPSLGAGVNTIRSSKLLPDLLPPDFRGLDLKYRHYEDFSDLFVGTITFPEYGDSGPDGD
jgi:hypothetical protein